MAFILRFIALVPLTVMIVNALPVSITERDISAGLLSQLSLFEQYSAAAYCAGNNIPGSSTAVTCSSGNCPQVQAAGSQTVLEFQNVGASDATGFVAVDRTNQLIVISFRGSRSLQNFIADLVLLLVPWNICSNCYAHAGFLDSWNSAKALVQAAVSQARASNPSYKIIATGHSLGGALATVAAADLRNSGYSIGLYTFGSPMVGNVPLATFITGQSGGNYRVTHANDVVPKLPGYPLGYAHVSPEYWITSPTGASVTASAIQVSSGVTDVQGNQGQAGGSVPDHLWYFNSIAGCAV